MNHIGKSACDQCSYCTEFCPRYLLGYEVQPHKVMRSLGFTMTGGDIWNQWSELCCACGLCTLYACPGGSVSRKRPAIDGKQDRTRGGAEVRPAEAGGGAPDEGVPARAALAIAQAPAGGRIRGRDAVSKPWTSSPRRCGSR